VAWATALWGGFSSFFSIWQVCILQISPFFMVYILGLYLTTEEDSRINAGVRLLLPPALYTLGFSVIYALLSSRSLDVGRLLISNINNLRIAAGFFIGLISLHFILAARFRIMNRRLWPITLTLGPLLLGISFAFIYSPCVTPTYAKILQISVASDTAMQGARLALIYGMGMGLSFSVVGLALILATRAMSASYKPLVRYFSGAVLGVLALMNITGVMVYYKAFFLGLLV